MDLIGTWLALAKDGVDAIKAAAETVATIRGMSGGGDPKKIDTAVDDTLAKLGEARREHLQVLDLATSLYKENSRLQDELRRKAAFESRSQAFELTALPEGGVVYAARTTGTDGKPLNYCCPNCFEQEVISYLQPVRVLEGRTIFGCARCPVKVWIPNEVTPRPVQRVRRMRPGGMAT